VELLTSLREAIDQLAGCDPAALADPHCIVDLQRQLARLECVVSRGVRAFELSGEWAPEGAKSPAAWLATRCRMPKAQARAQLRRGRALGDLPLAASAWAEGEIGGAHLDALAKVRTEASAGALARDEALLVHHATELRFEPFLGVLAYWGQLADPEGAEEADLARRARRDVYLTSSISGMYLGQMTFDPISGSIVASELERLEAELFEADWAQARAALGREPHLGELARTPGQRRADALVEMATRSRTAPENGRRPEPLFSVVVGYEALHGRICQLSGGTVVAPGSLLAYLEGADFERAVFRPGQRVEVSVTARLFSGATRRAIELRDRTCTHPFCDVPAERCQIDHIVPYALGGPTTQENGRVLCGFHNRLRNQRPPPAGPG
jgi:Domain of unknown function (DUF222)